MVTNDNLSQPIGLTKEANVTTGEDTMPEGYDIEQDKAFQTFVNVGNFMDVMLKSAIYKKSNLADELNPAARTIAEFSGHIGRDLALTLAGYSAVDLLAKGVSGIKWVSTAAKALSKVPSPITEGLRGASAGVVKSGFDRILNPDLDTYHSAIMAAELGGGDLSREIVNIGLRKLPLNPVLKEGLAYVADVVGGATVALGIHKQTDEYFREIIAPEAIAMGIVDLLLTGARVGKVPIEAEDLAHIKASLEEGYMSPEGAAVKLNEMIGDQKIDWEEIKTEFSKSFEGEIKKLEEVKKVEEATKVETKEQQVEDIDQPKMGAEEVTEETLKIRDEIINKAMENPISPDFQIPLVKPPEGSINTYRINADPETVGKILEMTDAIEKNYGKPKIKQKDVETKVKTEAETKAKQFKDDIYKSFVDELGFQVAQAQKLAEVLDDAPEQVLRYRNLVVDVGYATQHLAKQLKELKAQGVEIDPLQRSRFYEFVALYHDLTFNLDRISSRVAQTLSIFKVEADGIYKNLDDLDLEELFKNPDARTTLETLQDMKDFDELLDAVANAGDLKSLTKTVETNKSKFDTLLDKLITYKSMNVLTNFYSHMRNVTAQTAHMLWDNAIDYMGAFHNTVFSRDPSGMTFKKSFAKTVGNIEGIMHALYKPLVSVKDVYGVYHAKDSVSTLDVVKLFLTDPKKYNKLAEMTSLEGSRASLESLDNTLFLLEDFDKNSFLDFLKKGTDYFSGTMKTLSFGALRAGDRPFAYAGYFSELNLHLTDLATRGVIKKSDIPNLKKKVEDYRSLEMMYPSLYRFAKVEKGLDSKGTFRLLKEYFKNKGYDSNVVEGFLKEKIYNETVEGLRLIKDIDKIALNKAKEMTFKDDVEWGISKWFEQSVNLWKPIKLFQLFTHTPLRITEWGTRATGLSPYYWKKAFTSKNPLERQRAVGALYMAGLGALYTAIKYINGEVTPTWRDADERKRNQEAGIQENSIKIGDKWVNINQLDPEVSYIVTTWANIYRAMEEAAKEETPDLQKYFADTLIIVTNNLFNKTYTQNFADFLSIWNGTGFEPWIANQVESLKPFYGLNRFYHQTFDKYLTDLTGRVLKGSYYLDSFGKPIEQYNYFPTGLRSTKESTSPARKEALRLYDTVGFTIPYMNATLDGIKLTPEEHQILRALVNTVPLGKNIVGLEAAMNNIIQTETYQRLPDTEKAKLLSSIVYEAQEAARDIMRRMLIENGRYYQGLQENYQKRYQAKPKIPSPWVK
jgi:hypothetical protein